MPIRQLKRLVLFIVLFFYSLSWASESLHYDYEEIVNNYAEQDINLNNHYQLIIKIYHSDLTMRFLQLQQRWIRYRSLQCADSAPCRHLATLSQTENLNALLTGRLIFNNTLALDLKFDTNGEITTESYGNARSQLLDHYEKSISQLNKSAQIEQRRSYEIYNAYLYDYCEILSLYTPENFLNCQIKGLLDYQYNQPML